MSGPDFDHTFGNLSGKIKKVAWRLKAKLDLAYVTALWILHSGITKMLYYSAIKMSGLPDKMFYPSDYHLVET